MAKISKRALYLLFPILLSSTPTSNVNYSDVNYSKVDYSNLPVEYFYNLKTGIFKNKINISTGSVVKKSDGLKKSLEISILFNKVKYCFNKPNDSTYIETSSFPTETFIYKKRNDSWILTNYIPKDENKSRLYKKEFEQNKYVGKTLVDITSENINSIGDTINFFLLGENYHLVRLSDEFIEVGGTVVREGDEALFSNRVQLNSDNFNYPKSFQLEFIVENSLLKGNYTVKGYFNEELKENKK